MNYFDKDKRLLTTRACCKKILKTADVRRMLRERKKYITPEHIETMQGWKQHANTKLTKTEDKLESKRIYAEEKIKNLANQWENLTMKELEFRRVVEYFNESTIQIRQKMEREKLKKNALRENNITKQRGITRIRREIADFTYIIEEMKKETRKHIKYEEYLERFSEQYQFKAVGEVLQRYIILYSTREQVLRKLENTQCGSLQHKAEYDRILSRFEVESVQLSDVLTQQMRKYDEIQRQVRHWEGIVYGVTTHMTDLWREINMTRESMEQVVCLLLTRLNPGVPTQIMCNKEYLRCILSAETGHLGYVKKRLGDIEKLRIKLNTLIDEKGRTGQTLAFEEVEWWRGFSKPDISFNSGRKSSRRESTLDLRMMIPMPTSKNYPHFPHISAVTAKKLDEIRTSIKLAKKWEKTTKRKTMKADSSSEDYSIISDRDSRDKSFIRPSVSSGKKSKTLSTWEFLREIGDMTDEELIKTIVYLEPIAGKGNEPENKLDKEYTCASLTTDPLAMMQIEKQVNSRNRRIIERNFDRFEKKFNNPLRQESSSVLKINKETGNLELPKINYAKYQLPTEIRDYIAMKEARRAKMEDIIPQIAARISKIPRRVKASKLQSSPSKYSRTKKLSRPELKGNTFEDLTAFLNIPTILNKYKTEYL